VRLDGTLDAFSLPDILHLLTYTKKTGALHLRRESPAGHGVVFVTDGAVTGGSAEVSRQGLARRLVAVGDVGEEALAAAVRRVAASVACSTASASTTSGSRCPVPQPAAAGRGDPISTPSSS
jgi:hypothetical protein